ncbi:MAG: hypothetical protein CMA66_00930 [Euryarchaeota archaeon]|jgi:hypothetical protein|nr:hypothetical protein [Euryarchaeota archaeon]|tara:strand:- start:3535 stop:3906 length:372 start_codon:yes stop_codon:yes gene_type:complete
MATLNDRVLDSGLTTLDTEANRIDVCSQEPTTYAEATSTYTLGNSTSLSGAAPSDRSGGGREVVFAAITDGSITGTGTATHYSISDTNNSRLLVTGSLSASQSVTNGNSFTGASFATGIPDPS